MTAMIRGNAAPPPLTEAEAAAIEARVKALEARAGIQVVAAVVERSDVYHGLRWRAFAIAVSLAGLASSSSTSCARPGRRTHTVLLALALVLGAGAAAALAATVSPDSPASFSNRCARTPKSAARRSRCS